MKFRSEINGHTYWISGDKVMVSNGEVVHASHMDIETFNNAVAEGSMTEIKMTKDSFWHLVQVEKAANPGYNIRFLAFTVHKQGEAFKGNVINRKAAFMGWIADRKADYRAAYPEMLASDSIVDQDHFTGFIVSGDWMK